MVQSGCSCCLRSVGRSGCHTSTTSPSQSLSPWFTSWCSKELSNATGLDEATRGLTERGGGEGGRRSREKGRGRAEKQGEREGERKGERKGEREGGEGGGEGGEGKG